MPIKLTENHQKIMFSTWPTPTENSTRRFRWLRFSQNVEKLTGRLPVHLDRTVVQGAAAAYTFLLDQFSRKGRESRMLKRWNIAPVMQGCMEKARQLKVPPLVAQLLHNRGVSDEESIRSFLQPELKMLHPPEQLPGVSKAAAIIAEKIRQGKSIAIYGDYDVDGVSGVSILWQLLTLAGADVSYYIPHRLEEGYGLKGDALRQLHEQGIDTVVTVDCGATAMEEARLAGELGLNMVITDHHTLGDELPPAAAVVHPALDNEYPNPELCGAGVAFKLAWGIAQELSQSDRVNEEFREFLVDATGMAALGTIADVVPLTGENRIIARFGLTGLGNSRHAGLKALIESVQLTDRRLDTEHAGFWLAPRLNAAGRMGHANLAVELFTSADEERAQEIAEFLADQNRKRQTVERRIFEQACKRVEEENLAGDHVRAIVLADEEWHAGVIGIVASRLVERFHRPTVMIALQNGEGQGSARSIRHFHMHQALCGCAEHMLGFGGHAMAAGLRIASDRVEDFTNAFIEHANRMLTAQDLRPTLNLDAEVRLSSLNEQTVRYIDKLGPFGVGNPKARFATHDLQLDGEPKLVGRNNDHLSFYVTDGRHRRRAIAFKQKDKYQPLLDSRRCRLAFVPKLNSFNGRTAVELQVLDIAFPES
jgi:single-stranded-DNA-specific exonuclease